MELVDCPYCGGGCIVAIPAPSFEGELDTEQGREIMLGVACHCRRLQILAPRSAESGMEREHGQFIAES